MTLPTAETPLYNHPLPEIEKWLQDLGCQQNREQLHCWTVERSTWQAEICLDIEELTVNYLNKESEEKDIQRSFRYSLSRQDIESAVFSGP
jgi:Protein of unknown function (DUF3143)